MVGLSELSKRLRHLSSLQHSPTRRRLKRFTASEILVKYCRNHNEIRVKHRSSASKVKVFLRRPRIPHLKMQISCALLLCTLVVVYAAETPRPQVSDTALEEALNDKRFIQRQLKCALGEAPCDPIGKRLKTLAPLVLRGACPQCSPQETKQIQKTLSYVQRNFPQQWAKIVRQYAG